MERNNIKHLENETTISRPAKQLINSNRLKYLAGFSEGLFLLDGDSLIPFTFNSKKVPKPFLHALNNDSLLIFSDKGTFTIKGEDWGPSKSLVFEIPCKVLIEKTKKQLKVVVEDKGVERDEKKEKHHPDKEELQAMELLESRLRLQNNMINSIEFLDLKNSNGKPIGTKVTLLININE